ncbi:hypothetical protein GIB67_014125 [Kingdonia uniflora]|uniref:Cystatin domain-containing protein n=1 Tax=Kingdonia uniflora TaxID=39325 RepID=A0A7J7N465_9MAGN|nr:hypothetical protein GIB67_014125 [Kingdonia uniflora]
MMKTQSLLSSLLVSLFLLLVLPNTSDDSISQTKGILGGWKPIKDVNDPHIQEIAKFAITEHNSQAKSEFKFQSVIKGESQVVSGINYHLNISAKLTGVSSEYEVVVWEKNWAGIKKLTSFRKI